MIEQMVMSMIAAVVFGLTFYMKKNEPFDGYKLLTTGVIGLIIGAVSASLGVVPTEEYVVAQFTAYAGLSMMVENGLKFLWKKLSGQ